MHSKTQMTKIILISKMNHFKKVSQQFKQQLLHLMTKNLFKKMKMEEISKLVQILIGDNMEQLQALKIREDVALVIHLELLLQSKLLIKEKQAIL